MTDTKNHTTRFNDIAQKLIEERNEYGFWKGKLASSALAGAVACVALHLYDPSRSEKHVHNGINWLVKNMNDDGGFGDTPESLSNMSTSLLVYAAIHFCPFDPDKKEKAIERMRTYFNTQNIDLNTEKLSGSVLEFYGRDYTFSVPILTFLAICKATGEDAYRYIPQLPFELSLFPASFFRFLNLQVVSYAIPALIAVGIALFNHKKRKNPLTSLIRKGAVKPVLKKLEKMVPESGGFLEAVPLTAFVSCCLMVSGHKENNVVTKGITFLLDLQREDGSWPIDTDLATWVTTLSVKAFGSRINQLLDAQRQEDTCRFLRSVQNTRPHPFNGAAPGGWGWTNFSGSVPDADDTAGTILALFALHNGKKDISNAIRSGCYWLMNLQNRDGGVPTFCKGWGKLPFDKSCADLSGHALLALVKSGNFLDLTSGEEKKFTRSIHKLLKYLAGYQGDDGSWSPLWFGNQHHPEHKNPVYGTSKVCVYLSDSLQSRKLADTQRRKIQEILTKGRQYLLSQQNEDGSWGGQKGIPGSIEETSLAVSALVSYDEQACEKGFGWLEEMTKTNGFPSSPIGLYFASLWYDEKLYPLIFYTEALRRYTDFADEQIHENKHLKIEI